MVTQTHFDVPPNGVVTAPVAQLFGWIASGGTKPVTPLGLVNDQRDFVPLAAVDRPDVRIALPTEMSSGFSGWIEIDRACAGPWRLRYLQADETRETAVVLSAEGEIAARFAQAKARKLAAIRGLLRCPACRGMVHDDGDGGLQCELRHRFAVLSSAYHMMTEDFSRRAGADPTTNVSGHGYDATLLGLIAGAHGPILDAGAGLRPDYREDIVNLDIVSYPTTDVVAVGERLPFADDTFDLVISSAVLEHVRNPFAAARELERVLRPGGRIFAAVPFLQPYHGYPHHYYNMTSAGLRNLFRRIEPESLEVPAAGHPVFALTWILRAWQAALPPHIAAGFANMTVAQLSGAPEPLLAEDFALHLPPATRTELAALNLLIGRKRGAESGEDLAFGDLPHDLVLDD